MKQFIDMVETVEIDTVKLNEENPRILKDDKFKKLVTSIKNFPKMLQLRPIVVNADMVVLGGNMRLQACKKAGLKEVTILKAEHLTEEEQKEFIIKDNVGFGEWDWGVLANEWDTEKIEDWGLDIIGFDVDHEDFNDEFSLDDGDKSPFQQQTYTLADEQAEVISNAITEIKLTDDYKYCETFGNENSNGNALYLIVSEWAGQRK